MQNHPAALREKFLHPGVARRFFCRRGEIFRSTGAGARHEIARNAPPPVKKSVTGIEQF
jgi:hypothetical protein